MKEKVFVDLWGAESNFHTGLVVKDTSVSDDLGGSDSAEEGEDALPLTEEEVRYHANLSAKEKKEKLKAIAANQAVEVSKYARNAFLPTVSPRWVESQSREVEDKLWDLPTFNYVAPIHSDSYRFLASLTDQEMLKCSEKALTENTDLCKGDFPLTAENMMLPTVGVLKPSRLIPQKIALTLQ
ncbi:hypothetical protein CBR_g50456 [Chara braunii]|uniref:Uncharacterized protein n=1 Tax=Chara braunii TaxID=69332 RepID=A0A388M6R8_CHABU|nr:hypothetical protein CBR_g50456 [Chara braunii]|eukprot:GBG90278.1 hypothetical protein CBR_g50456 [Chara braunii]